MMKTYLLKVYGIVQGVGFRPFVFRLAERLKLKGYVLNTTSGVEIVVEGDELKVEEFVLRLKREAPPLSKVERIEKYPIKEKNFKDFTIKESEFGEGFNFISPDIAICDDCLREMFDPKDRRYKYPFINCTNCGPRYTIIEDLPYDRERTTMKVFKMCVLCKEEYENPYSRRFHAQPNACFTCGPKLWYEREGEKVEDVDEIFDVLSKILKRGGIVAIKGIGGFHLACDATNDDAVYLLRMGKKRPSKPFALMMKDVEMVKRYCFLNKEEEEILKSKERPIVLLRIKDLKSISPQVSPNNNYLGVMLPYAPYHYLIFEKFSKPIVMTSGNISDEPIVKDNHEAKEKLKNITDHFILHNRGIRHRIDDSVLFVERERVHFIRRARGFAPEPIKIPLSLKPVLALGGDLKNTFSLGFKNYVFMSPHIGDLKDVEVNSLFEETIEEFIRLFKIEPEIVVSDMHPGYFSNSFAERFRSQGKVVKHIQHHKAHAFSLILDRGISDRIVVFTFDGTGFGEDGNIWGGEAFYGGIDGFKRISHFKYFPFVGGDYAILNPKITLLSYLLSSMEEHLSLFMKKYSEMELEIIKAKLKEKPLLTSSCGRIFDIVSSLLNIRDAIDYEGQAAIELEMVSSHSNHEEFYPFDIEKDGSIIDFYRVIEGIITDVKRGRDVSYIGRKFHNTIGRMVFSLSKIFLDKFGTKKIGFSGGVFHNRLLINILYNLFDGSDFELFFHENVPTNDGGISLGQTIVGKE